MGRVRFGSAGGWRCLFFGWGWDLWRLSTGWRGDGAGAVAASGEKF